MWMWMILEANYLLLPFCSCQDGGSVQWYRPPKKDHAQRRPDDPVAAVSYDPTSLDRQTWREVLFLSRVFLIFCYTILNISNSYFTILASLALSVLHHCVVLYQQTVTMWRSRGTRWRPVWRPWMVMSSGFWRKWSATTTPPTSNISVDFSQRPLAHFKFYAIRLHGGIKLFCQIAWQ